MFSSNKEVAVTVSPQGTLSYIDWSGVQASQTSGLRQKPRYMALSNIHIGSENSLEWGSWDFVDVLNILQEWPNCVIVAQHTMPSWEYIGKTYGIWQFEAGCHMIRSSNGNIFRVTGPLYGEFTSHRWIPLTKARDARLWGFVWSAPEQTVE